MSLVENMRTPIPGCDLASRNFIPPSGRLCNHFALFVKRATHG